MLQPRSAAIVPRAAKNAKVVQFAADGLAADVRVQAQDRRGRSHIYAIRLASSELEVTGRLVGLLPSGESVELGGLAVAPGSIGSARCAVATPRGGAYEGVYLEIRSESVLLQVEAPKLPARRRVRPLAVGAAVLALGAASAGAGGLALALPQTPVFKTPDAGIAGTRIRVPYATHGTGAVAYAARFDDGTIFASGPLGAPAGEISLTLPRDASNRRVSIAVSLQGVLGTRSGVAAFPVSAPPVLRVADVPARVLSFSAHRETGAAGESVLASYLAIAERGAVRLQDRAGRVVASAPFGHVGTTRLAIPAALHGQPLTATLAVDRGRTHAVASIALDPGTPDPHVSPSPLPTGAPAIAAHDTGVAKGMLEIEGRPVAGGPLALRIMPHSAAMQLALQSATGETVAETAVRPGTSRVSLPLPDAAATYFLVLRSNRNGSEETTVRSIRVATR